MWISFILLNKFIGFARSKVRIITKNKQCLQVIDESIDKKWIVVKI